MTSSRCPASQEVLRHPDRGQLLREWPSRREKLRAPRLRAHGGKSAFPPPSSGRRGGVSRSFGGRGGGGGAFPHSDTRTRRREEEKEAGAGALGSRSGGGWE